MTNNTAVYFFLTAVGLVCLHCISISLSPFLLSAASCTQRSCQPIRKSFQISLQLPLLHLTTRKMGG